MSVPMKAVHLIPLLALLAFTASPTVAQGDGTAAPAPVPSPGEIAAAAPAPDWIDIAPQDLLVMTLAPDAKGKPRTAIIQLLPAPFSQGWVSNIRAFANAHYWDGLTVYRVQDNYVTQWGDPEDDDKKARKKPVGLKEMAESDYVYPRGLLHNHKLDGLFIPRNDVQRWSGFFGGFPIAGEGTPDSETNWPTHCYGMVGVARGQRPGTGDGSTLYTVIGHAPRHLDRNIALVGRVIEGMEFLSSLPRGAGAQGFYEDASMQVPIVSVRLASDLPAAEQPHVQYLSTESTSFAKYADARANRRDPFFLVPAGGADICNIPVPIRRKP
jgi:cyclophilin family peptidyl-prolyl cis-trans isomerase